MDLYERPKRIPIGRKCCAAQLAQQQRVRLVRVGIGNLERVGSRWNVQRAFVAGLKPQLGGGNARIGAPMQMIERKLVPESPQEDAQRQRQQSEGRETGGARRRRGRPPNTSHRRRSGRRHARCWTAGRQRSCLSQCLQRQRGSECIVTRFNKSRWKFLSRSRLFRRTWTGKALKPCHRLSAASSAQARWQSHAPKNPS